jgi:tetratricopeptide (TPR) repeat protein
MKILLKILKKDLFLTSLSLLAFVFILWFCLDRKGFKAVLSKNPAVAAIIKEHNLVEEKSKIASILPYYPYLPYFAGIVIGIEQPKPEWMETYYLGKPYIFCQYYQKVIEMYPDNDAAHFLLGYSEYYLGNPTVALAQFERAIELNPAFFWSYYDLGAIYFKQGDFLKSAVILNKALSLNKVFTLRALSQGIFYWQIWRNIANPSQVLAMNLNEGQADAAFLLAAYFVKAGGFDQALQIIQSAGRGPWHQELWEDLRKKAAGRQRATEDIDRLIQGQIPVRLF